MDPRSTISATNFLPGLNYPQINIITIYGSQTVPLLLKPVVPPIAIKTAMNSINIHIKFTRVINVHPA